MSVDRAIDGAKAYLMATLGLLGACGGKATVTSDAEAGATTGHGDGAGGFLTCSTIACAMGRPFLVQGAERMAEPVAGSGWRDAAVAPDLTACHQSARARLEAHWTRIALMEHASIAAFARFTLHLLALGAPQHLVSLSQKAMGDEAEHARLAFTLASAYAGTAIGPEPLALDGALDGFNLGAFLECLVGEGCIGETTAAIEAMAALELVRDPVVRNALEAIARDELRHAELAWRTLAWLLAEGRVGRSAVRVQLVAALGEPLRPYGHGRRPERLWGHRRPEARRAAAVRNDRRHRGVRRRAAGRPTPRCGAPGGRRWTRRAPDAWRVS